jgi:hypothetical protein
MTANPSLLLRSHNQIEDAEDILYDLLHSLSHLSSPTKPAGENLLHWTAGILFQGLPDFDIDEKRTEQDVFEWKCGLVLLRKLIKFFLEQDGTGGSVTDSSSDVSCVPPHGLLRCVVDRCLGFRDEQEDGLTLFNILCILLVSEAIHKCYVNALHERRWRRTQSMCMEALALYQTLFLRNIGRDTDPQKLDDFKILSSLYCDFLSPALCDLLEVMEEAIDFEKGPNEHKNKAIAAGMVNVASTLSFTIVEAFMRGSDNEIALGNSLVLDLTKEMLKIPLLRQDYIWMHPLRFEYESSRCNFFHESDESEVETLIESHAGQRVLHELSPLLCNSCGDLGLDFNALLGMNVQWDERALAVMIHAAISEDTIEYSSLMPRVYSKPAVFKMVMPHVAVLLNLSQREATDSEQDIGESNSTTVQAIQRQRYFDMAITVLKHIFMLKGNEILCTCRGDSHSLAKGVLGPVGAIQLLLNHLVNISSSTLQNQLPREVGKGMRNDVTCSQQELILIIRSLISCYSVAIQISSIGLLVKLCPFPFLIPVLLDLLRNPVSSDEFSDILGVFVLLQPIIDEMISQKSVDDVYKLVENAETYTCVVSLFRLLYLGHRQENTKDGMNNMMINLELFRSVLRDLVEKAENNADSDDHAPISRIFLLEMALDDLVTVRDRLIM